MVAIAYDFDSDDAYKILSIVPVNTNSLIEINSNFYLSYDYKTSKITYKKTDDDEKDSYATIKVDACVYLNGVLQNKNLPVVNSMLEVFSETNTDSVYRTYGTYKLIDHDNDNSYDSIIITRYLDYLVSSFDIENNTVYDKFRNESLIIDEKCLRNGSISIVNETGKRKGIGDIMSAKIISVVKNNDDNLMTKGKIVVCQSVESGKAESLEIINDFSGKVSINSKVYYYYKTKIQTSYDYYDYGMEVGDIGIFYTNAVGDIVYKDTKGGLSLNYALLTSIKKNDALSNKCMIKVFTAKGEEKIYPIADTLTLKREPEKTDTFRGSKIASALLGNKKSITTLIPISYKLNLNYEINEICYPYNNVNKKPLKQVFTLDRQFNLPDDSSQAAYNKNIDSIGDIYANEATVVFGVNNVNVDDYIAGTVENVDIGSLSILSRDDIQNGYNGYCEGYSIQTGNDVNMMVLFDPNPKKEIISSFFVVKSIVKSVNKNGDPADKAICYKDGEEAEYFIKADAEIYYDDTFFKVDNDNKNYFGAVQSLEKNDLIDFSQNATGEIDKIRIIMRSNRVVNYLPYIYMQQSVVPPVNDLNIMLDAQANHSGEEIKYYYGIITAKNVNAMMNKLTLTVNDLGDGDYNIRKQIDNGDFTYDQFSRLTVTLPMPPELRILRLSKNNKLSLASFYELSPDVIIGDTKTGDMAFVKTVNGLVSDIFLIGAE